MEPGFHYCRLLLHCSSPTPSAPFHRYFSQAEAASPKAVMEPGFHYCKGVYARYTNNPREALKELNLARKDTKVWGGMCGGVWGEVWEGWGAQRALVSVRGCRLPLRSRRPMHFTRLRTE